MTRRQSGSPGHHGFKWGDGIDAVQNSRWRWLNHNQTAVDAEKKTEYSALLGGKLSKNVSVCKLMRL